MTTPRILTTDEASTPLLEAIRRLMDEAFEGSFSDHDWVHATGGRHVVVVEGRQVLAHAAVVPRTLEVTGLEVRSGYVEGVATARTRRNEGLGSLVMRTLMGELRSRYRLGALSTARHAFYERLGWERWQGPTFVRDGDVVRRTPDDDDGLMVLRTGPSEGIALDGPIVCRARPGDDW